VRRVLVPLDGTDLAAAILPDARRLAGRGGELVLIRDATGATEGRSASSSVEMARDYLDAVAQTLRAEGVHVRTHPLAKGDAAVAIDEGAEIEHADMIAIATHGRSPEERLRYGSIAWRALLRSTVPVLLRHVDPEGPDWVRPEPERRRIMVPLDGSALAERALPLAAALAGEWQAALCLIRVALDWSTSEATTPEGRPDVEAARDYLQRVANRLGREVEAQVLRGDVVETLVDAVERLSVTDIVMTTHGQTGLTRVIVGGIADALIHRLYCPIVVIPALATVIPE
jgi:nucleotide-binding universal stress UspA family protein